MKVYFRLLLVPILFFSQTASFAGEADDANSTVQDFCIKDEKEYNTNKSRLPAYFQTMPAIMGVETTVLMTDVLAVMTIQFRNGVLVLKSDVWKKFAYYPDLQEIKQVCFQPKNKKMIIIFNTKDAKPQEVSYRDNEFITEGVALKRITEKEFKEIGDKIKVKSGEKKAASEPEVNK